MLFTSRSVGNYSTYLHRRNENEEQAKVLSFTTVSSNRFRCTELLLSPTEHYWELKFWCFAPAGCQKFRFFSSSGFSRAKAQPYVRRYWQQGTVENPIRWREWCENAHHTSSHRLPNQIEWMMDRDDDARTLSFTISMASHSSQVR
jgi:hypothetical protein